MKYQVALAPLLLLFAFACSSGDKDNEGKLRVVATTTQIGDFARVIGGEQIALTVLLKPNQDAHDFEPSPGQVRDLQEATVVLRHGLDLDTYVDNVDIDPGRVAVVTEGIEVFPGGGHGEEEHEDESDGEGDPHVWFDVSNVMSMAGQIRDALVAADATNAATFRENAEKYLGELRALDSEIKTQANQIPQHCRKLVTNHDVLGYYAAAYGFEVVGAVIPATTTEAQASARDVADIVNKIRAAGVPAIFAEASVNPDLMKQVAREANVKLVDDLYADSLGAKGSDGETYVGMMRTNTNAIVEALKGCA